MVPIQTPTAPPVTMAWNDEPTASAALASEASSLNSAMQSAIASLSMEDGMTMSDGSVMPMSAMSGMSGMSGAMATGTAMDGMNMTGSAGSMKATWGLGMGVAVALGLI